jgi:hypothetical protein
MHAIASPLTLSGHGSNIRESYGQEKGIKENLHLSALLVVI